MKNVVELNLNEVACVAGGAKRKSQAQAPVANQGFFSKVKNFVLGNKVDTAIFAVTALSHVVSMGHAEFGNGRIRNLQISCLRNNIHTGIKMLGSAYSMFALYNLMH